MEYKVGMTMKDAKKAFLVAALNHHGGVKATALALGMSVHNLYSFMHRYGIKRTSRTTAYGYGDVV